MPTVNKLREQERLRSTVNARSAESFTRQRPDYIQGPNLRNGAWTQLSSALSSVEPELQQYAYGNHVKETRESTAEGKALFNANQMSWKEFSETNPEYAGANPWLKRGYNESHLGSVANQFKMDMQKHYTDNGLQNERDTTVVQQSLGEFTKQWREQNLEGFDELDVAEFFDEDQAKTLSGMSSVHGRLRMQNIITENKEMLGREIGSQVEAAGTDFNIDWGDPDLKAGSLQGLGAQISESINKSIAAGLPATEANAQAVDSIVTMAKDMEDDDILDLLDTIDTGNGPLGGTNYARAKRTQMENFLEQKEASDRDEAWKMRQRANVIKGEQAAEAAGSYWEENPNATFADFRATHPDIGSENMDAIAKYRNLSLDLHSWKMPETEGTLRNFMADRIQIAEGEMGFYDLLNTSTQYGPGRMKENLDYALSWMKHKEVQTNTQVKQYRKTVGKMVQNPESYDKDPSLANEAMFLYDNMMLDWAEDFKKDNPGERPSAAKIQIKAVEVVEQIAKMERYKREDPGKSFQPSKVIADPSNPVFQFTSPEQLLEAFDTFTQTGLGPFAALVGDQDPEEVLAESFRMLGMEPLFKEVDEEDTD